ncbi:MAG TPA: tetraacyldisaccharide 4'-kinase [Rhizomicrobium sp.]|nr:tetraacyldisaccharide 4'-kinase [Rhizomicrobium sp.]
MRHAPDFWRTGGMWAGLLSPLGALYGLSVRLKARWARPFTADVPVICVGNLTAGGSGKTPIAIAIAEALRARGLNPFFLTRGHGGSERGPALAYRAHSAAQMGDEALLLARTAQTVVARDRAAGARLAQDKGATALVMDDGHQHFTLHKTLSLVVVDAATGFGNGRCIPAGSLREPVTQGLARADAVILVGDGSPDLRGYAGPVLRAHLQARLRAGANDFSGKPVFAFAGIGRPEKFIASLEDSGALLMGSCFFPDHHPYADDEIEQLRLLAGEALLVTTEKDFVRMTPEQRQGIRTLKVAADFDDPAALAALLDRIPVRRA